MLDGRRADATRRRDRVIKAITTAASQGDAPSVSSIARLAGVDRSYLYRHRDLLERIHAAAATPAPGEGSSSVSRASLQTDLANALQRNTRLAARVRQLEAKLSDVLGQQAWSRSGLEAPADIDSLQRKIVEMEQSAAAVRLQLEEREEELAAARSANRELTRALNQSSATASH
jgi:transposase-like protein